ncbi:hypothetical protein [Sphingorhabdus sp. YGSMI21]|uniref:hypothetical protein n=1 Tax=Sphingorhabdus sp. YGSMI21 TaxID=2077182 RepID=UPI000C1E1167|nr:hypothetical protein [Sphingorhabdus sp. YGSMI21]ATW03116.1 hypothetical protein CHN51_05835 [Sphingorhabdus sp. YGSMI21]
MSKTKFLLHIGYGKTGTSTLQKAVFEPLRQAGYIHYFGMFLGEQKDHPDRCFFDDLQAAMYLKEDAFAAVLPKLHEDLVAAEARNDANLPMVLSNEHFLLSSFSSRVRGVTIDVQESARRLALVFAQQDVRLLIGLRRQDSLLHSLFIEAIARTRHANADQFESLEAYVAECLSQGSLFHSMYDYDQCIATYQANFPDAELGVYLFEDFIRNEQDSLRMILGLADIKQEGMEVITLPLPNHNVKDKAERGVRVRQKSALVDALDWIPGVRSAVRFARMIKPIENLRTRRIIPYLDESQKKQILTTFELSNVHLQERVPRIAALLSEYGYTRQDRSD